MLLCDAAQVSDGKLYILGGGWSMTGPDPVPSAVALKIDVDWNEAGSPHHWELFLVDADGQPVISYYDSTNGDLKVAKCANPACTGASALTTGCTASQYGSE